MKRDVVIGASAGALALAAIITAAAVAATPGVDMTANRAPAPTSTSSSASSSPRPSPSPDDAAAAPDDADVPAAIDPYYGDAVAAVATGDSAELGGGLVVELVSVSTTTVTGSGIGSTSGPAIVVELSIANTGATAADLAAVVNAYAGSERTPLTPAGEDEQLASQLAAGAESTGRYTFAIDDPDQPLYLTVSTSPDSGLVVFERG